MAQRVLTQKFRIPGPPVKTVHKGADRPFDVKEGNVVEVPAEIGIDAEWEPIDDAEFKPIDEVLGKAKDKK